LLAKNVINIKERTRLTEKFIVYIRLALPLVNAGGGYN